MGGVLVVYITYTYVSCISAYDCVGSYCIRKSDFVFDCTLLYEY